MVCNSIEQVHVLHIFYPVYPWHTTCRNCCEMATRIQFVYSKPPDIMGEQHGPAQPPISIVKHVFMTHLSYRWGFLFLHYA